MTEQQFTCPSSFYVKWKLADDGQLRIQKWSQFPFNGAISYSMPAEDAPGDTPTPVSSLEARWFPIDEADRTINHVTEFTQIGLTLKNSDTFWVRDEDGRVYRAAWSEGNNGRDYWWDWEAESPVDPVEFMPHPLDPRFAATATEGE